MSGAHSGISIMAHWRIVERRDASGSATNAERVDNDRLFFFLVFLFSFFPLLSPTPTTGRSDRPADKVGNPFPRRPAGNVKRSLYVAISRFRSSEHNDEDGVVFFYWKKIRNLV